MTTYQDSGVNIQAGDEASKKAYGHAKTTFNSRAGMIGAPLLQEGGFSGALDMGDFLLVQNDDGVGTKMEIAERTGDYSTIGQDLVAMVADDAICVGAEVISLTNTIDTPAVDPAAIDAMTGGLGEACKKEKIVIPGGEIAELGNALNRMVWNATAVGIVKKEKFITGKNIKAGDTIIGLQGNVLRSNGISLARKICEKNFGPDWHNVEWQGGVTWGHVLLTPSKIYHRLLLETILGTFDEARTYDIHGLAHITGGGIPGNLPRIFPDATFGAVLDDLHSPHPALVDLKKLGNVEESECYTTWHCGTAMMIICDENDAKDICKTINDMDNTSAAKVVGHVTDTGSITIHSQFSGAVLEF